MRKIVSLVCSLFAVVTLSIGLSACKDDEPYEKPNLSINVESLTISEDGGIISVELVLDRAAQDEIIIQYTLGGTAVSPADYGIVGKDGEFTIPKGETSIALEIEIANDKVHEEDETIEISIENTNRDDVAFVTSTNVLINIIDDDEQIIASMATTSMTVKESDGEVEIVVNLSHPAPGNVSVYYTLAGTAKDSISASNEEAAADYAIRESIPGELKIAGGQTTGIIKLWVHSDFILEDNDSTTEELDPETIAISMTEVTDGIRISPSNSSVLINVQQEDGKVIALYWDENASVDMDLVLWYGNLGDNVSALQPFGGSWIAGTSGMEITIIPKSITDLAFGASYVYYSGNVAPLDFEVHFIDLVDGQFGSVDVYTGAYTLANLFVWETVTDLQDIEQTFQSVEGIIINVSPISIPLEGSRKSTHTKTAKDKRIMPSIHNPNSFK